MALGFLLIAVALIDVAYRNTQHVLFTQLTADMPGFFKWAIAITVIGALQWIPSIEIAAKYLLVLVLLVIVIANKGAFKNFETAVTGTAPTVQGGPQPSLTGNPTINFGGSSGSSAGSAISSVGGAISSITKLF